MGILRLVVCFNSLCYDHIVSFMCLSSLYHREIDYNYHAELSGSDQSGATKPRTTSEAPRLDAPTDLDLDEESGEWVYSSSFEDFQRGVVMGTGRSNAASPLAMSSIAEDFAPEDEDADSDGDDPTAASMRAALEAEYDLSRENMLAGEPVALVRQRRYERKIVRTHKPGEPAAAIHRTRFFLSHASLLMRRWPSLPNLDICLRLCGTLVKAIMAHQKSVGSCLLVAVCCTGQRERNAILRSAKVP